MTEQSLLEDRAQNLPRKGAENAANEFLREARRGPVVENPISFSHRPVILVPVDFSPASTRAARFAIALAKQCDAALVFFHAVHLNLTPCGPANLDRLKESLVDEARANAEPLLLAAQQLAVPAICDIQQGPPAAAIVQAAGQWHSQLILLAEPSRPWWTRWFVFSPSVLKRVIRAAPCGVLVLQPSAKIAEPATAPD